MRRRKARIKFETSKSKLGNFQAFPFSLNSTSCTRFKGLKIIFLFSWSRTRDFHVHHGYRDRGRGEVGQSHVGVKGIVKEENEVRGKIKRCFYWLM